MCDKSFRIFLLQPSREAFQQICDICYKHRYSTSYPVFLLLQQQMKIKFSSTISLLSVSKINRPFMLQKLWQDGLWTEGSFPPRNSSRSLQIPVQLPRSISMSLKTSARTSSPGRHRGSRQSRSPSTSQVSIFSIPQWQKTSWKLSTNTASTTASSELSSPSLTLRRECLYLRTSARH